MAPLNWARYLERAVGKGHPTLSDTVNRPLRQLLSESGYDPDATTFPGLAGPVANVKVYGTAVGSGGDDSAAFQAAIDTGLPIWVPNGNYKANNLTASTFGQCWFGGGAALIEKNGNGPILTVTAQSVFLHNLQFRGESATPVFTGDNLVFTNNNCGLINCGSRYAFGRAVKATGGHFQIIGTNDIYQSYDPGGTGYDIEIGISGTATLYHQLVAVYTSQGSGTNAGGILLTDTGSAIIQGGQYGKLSILRGTGPAGINGGSTLGSRILGTVTIDQASAIFTGCEFAAIVVTLTANANNCSIDASNIWQGGSSCVNNGNNNNLILRQVSGGSTIDLKFGQDSSAAILKITPTTSPVFEFPWDVVIPNTRSFYTRNAAAGLGASLSQNASGDVFLTDLEINRTLAFQTTGTGSGSRHQFNVNGVAKACVDNNGIIIGASGSPQLRSGSGSPEGAVTAPVGSLYVRTDGGALTSLYVKESGAGTTGWVAK